MDKALWRREFNAADGVVGPRVEQLVRVEGQALLRDHVRDRSGGLHVVLVPAHFAEEKASVFAGLGLETS